MHYFRTKSTMGPERHRKAQTHKKKEKKKKKHTNKHIITRILKSQDLKPQPQTSPQKK